MPVQDAPHARLRSSDAAPPRNIVEPHSPDELELLERGYRAHAAARRMGNGRGHRRLRALDQFRDDELAVLCSPPAATLAVIIVDAAIPPTAAPATAGRGATALPATGAAAGASGGVARRNERGRRRLLCRRVVATKVPVVPVLFQNP